MVPAFCLGWKKLWLRMFPASAAPGTQRMIWVGIERMAVLALAFPRLSVVLSSSPQLPDQVVLNLVDTKSSLRRRVRKWSAPSLKTGMDEGAQVDMR